MDIHKDQYQAHARETVLRFLFTVTKNWSNGLVGGAGLMVNGLTCSRKFSNVGTAK